MPLQLAVSIEGQWKPVGIVKPGKNGSLSDNSTPGRREIYLFACATGDDWSEIRRSPSGLDLCDDTGSRTIFSVHEGPDSWPLVKKLEPNVRFEMTVQPDGHPAPLKIRFTHVPR